VIEAGAAERIHVHESSHEIRSAFRARDIGAFVLVMVLPFCLLAQAPADSTTSGARQSPSAPTIDFSGVLFANFQYRGDAGTSKAFNKFDVERAYLTLRMPAGDRLSVRITADVFQQGAEPNDAFYKGWVVRAKYAYLQYEFLRGQSWRALARAGLLQNVVIDHIESFWPRWIALSPMDRAGFFSSADAGVSALVTFPSKMGEAYFTIVNGPGYTSRETDRFKDYAARVTLTPFASTARTLFKTVTVSGWTYFGALGSAFAAGGPGQLGAVGSALPRRRAGVFLGLKDPRLSAGVEIDRRKDGTESGANTLASPRVEIDSSGRLIAAFASVKPFELLAGNSRIPLGVVARWDRFTPNTAVAGYVDFFVGGLTWDLSRQAAISLDYQEQIPHNGAIAPAPKIYFVHLVANF